MKTPARRWRIAIISTLILILAVAIAVDIIFDPYDPTVAQQHRQSDSIMTIRLIEQAEHSGIDTLPARPRKSKKDKPTRQKPDPNRKIENF